MAVEEVGVVVGKAEGRAKVRAEAGSQCSGCGAAKYCRGGTSEGEKIIEAENPVGAVHGDRVVIAVPAGALLRASFRVYVVPVIGILAGAGIAQYAVQAFAGPQAAGAAAGIGGLAGAAVSVLVLRRLHRRRPDGDVLRPTIVRIVG